MVCMITYALLSSLKVTSFFSMVTTRFITDSKFYEKNWIRLCRPCMKLFDYDGFRRTCIRHILIFFGITPGMQL